MSILTPAISGVDNIWMFMGIYLFSNILWLFGINGSSIVFQLYSHYVFQILESMLN